MLLPETWTLDDKMSLEYVEKLGGGLHLSYLHFLIYY